MLRGIADVSLDERGRMALPGRFRDAFANGDGGQAIVTIDRQDRCLLVYPTSEWLRVEERLSALANASRTVRRLQRMLIGFASEVELDSQNRLLIPGRLRSYAQLERKAVLLGQLNKLELWSTGTWQGNMDAWLEQSNAEPEPEDAQRINDLQI